MSTYTYLFASSSPILVAFLLSSMMLNFVIKEADAVTAIKREELPEFFKSTYIMKQPGYIQPVDQSTATVAPKKQQYAHGFNPAWNIFRLHHVSEKTQE